MSETTNIDGKMSVAGSVTVGGNLTVTGAVDAANVRGAGKGLFPTRDSLLAAYPYPRVGWWALVYGPIDEEGATAGDAVVMLCVKNAAGVPVWTSTGESAGLASLVDRFKEVEDMKEALSAFYDTFTTTTEGLGAEISSAKSELEQSISETNADLSALTERTAAAEATLQSVVDVLKSGEMSGGTARFNGVMNLEDNAGTLKSVDAGDDYDGVCWLEDKQIFAAYKAALSLSGVTLTASLTYYTRWDGVADFMKTAGTAQGLWQNKAYIHGGGLYIWVRCDECLKRVAGDEYALITDEEIEAIFESFMFVNPEDYTDEDAEYFLNQLRAGALSGGTARFNGVMNLTDNAGTVVDGYAGEEYDGICWLEDRQMFAAYRAVLDTSGETPAADITYYTRWATDRLFMEETGTAQGLWQDKAYIHGGGLYIWVRCDECLKRIAGDDYTAITDEEIDNIFDDFLFVDPDEWVTSWGDDYAEEEIADLFSGVFYPDGEAGEDEDGEQSSGESTYAPRTLNDAGMKKIFALLKEYIDGTNCKCAYLHSTPVRLTSGGGLRLTSGGGLRTLNV